VSTPGTDDPEKKDPVFPLESYQFSPLAAICAGIAV
jgi:hypothetical protein